MPAPAPAPAGGAAMPAAPAALSPGSLGAPPAAAAATPSAVIKTLEDFAAAVADIDDVSDLLLYSAAEMAKLLEENASLLKDGSKLPGQKQREMLMAQHAELLAAKQPGGAAAAPEAMDSWLVAAELGKYVDAIKDYGYDSIAALRVASEEDIQAMTEDADIGMKKPHRKLMLAKWRELSEGD